MSIELEGWGLSQGSTPSSEKGTFKVCGQESRRGQGKQATWGDQNGSGFIEEKERNKPRKREGPCIPQGEVMGSPWHFLNRAVSWLDLGWRKSNLIAEIRLAARKLRAKSPPFLATSHNLSISTKGIYYIQFSLFLYFPLCVFYFLKLIIWIPNPFWS